jgi:ABC-type multidrug transport system fused ATPase/permease subunit
LNNDSLLSSHNSLSKCLVGTVLLLDEILSQMSETEEIDLIKRLKSSGAAILLSSNRWALGRFADRIIVLKNGAIVESGGHAELLSLGRIYASRWNAMA